MVGQEQEGLSTVSPSDGADDPGCFDLACRIALEGLVDDKLGDGRHVLAGWKDCCKRSSAAGWLHATRYTLPMHNARRTNASYR